MYVRVIQLAFERLCIGGFGLIEAIQIDVVEPEDKVRHRTVRTQTDRLSAFFHRILKFSKGRVDWAGQESTRHRIARIGLRPELARLLGFQQIPCSHDIEVGGDEILFCLASGTAKFVGFS